MHCARTLGALLVCAVGMHGHAGEEHGLSSEEIVKLAGKPDALTLVTPEPVKLAMRIALYCGRAPQPSDHAEMLTRRETRTQTVYVKVYVSSPAVADTLKTEKPVFPVGTFILKKKFLKGGEDAPELYTAMLKRESGYNAAAGDWEFLTLAGDAKSVTERGKLESCMACHRVYKEHDFVTAKYK